jgi:pyruvate/2-oxoglutarate dehydrogenase complex dihydrolipoamide dehydrogenase (E3) component
MMIRRSSARSASTSWKATRAKDFVIATGSRTAIPPVEGLQESGFLDHATFLAQDTFPASVLILGGGYIGIEFAQIFSRFGSRVTVVEMADEIISKEDAQIITRVREILAGEQIALHTGWTVKSVRRDGAKKVARIENKLGESREITVDEVFVASGRRGNTETLGLDAAGVKVERTWVVTDRFLQTSAPRIWACGDVHGGMQFTHSAAYEAVKLVRNMLFPGKSAADYTHVPWALYTDPEVGHIGMTEAEARAKHGEDVRTYVVEMNDVDRAVVDRATSGLIKLVADAKGHILGGHVLCANASTVIEEVVLARRKGMKVGDLAQRISSYPSLADGVQKAASLYYQDVAKSWLGAAGKLVAAISQ